MSQRIIQAWNYTIIATASVNWTIQNTHSSHVQRRFLHQKPIYTLHNFSSTCMVSMSKRFKMIYAHRFSVNQITNRKHLLHTMTKWAVIKLSHDSWKLRCCCVEYIVYFGMYWIEWRSTMQLGADKKDLIKSNCWSNSTKFYLFICFSFSLVV